MPSRIRLVEGLQLPDVMFAFEEELVHMGRGPLVVTLRQVGYGAWSGAMVVEVDESTQRLDEAEQAAGGKAYPASLLRFNREVPQPSS